MTRETNTLSAYVLVYGPVELFARQELTWQARVETAEGFLRFPRTLSEYCPYDEVGSAILALAAEERLSTLAAAELGTAWERWRGATENMLRVLRRNPRGGFPDKEGLDLAPGATDLVRFLRRTRTSLNGDPHLEGWRSFGERLARLTLGGRTARGSFVAPRLNCVLPVTTAS